VPVEIRMKRYITGLIQPSSTMSLGRLYDTRVSDDPYGIAESKVAPQIRCGGADLHFAFCLFLPRTFGAALHPC
jgi:hypothetical protein